MSNDAELYPGGTASGTTSTFGDMLRQNMRSEWDDRFMEDKITVVFKESNHGR